MLALRLLFLLASLSGKNLFLSKEWRLSPDGMAALLGGSTRGPQPDWVGFFFCGRGCGIRKQLPSENKKKNSVYWGEDQGGKQRQIISQGS
jgi:hypothetical protein